MKFLQKLEICRIYSLPIEPIIVACSMLEELVLKCKPLSYNILGCLDMWANSGFKPPNLSVVKGARGLKTIV